MGQALVVTQGIRDQDYQAIRVTQAQELAGSQVLAALMGLMGHQEHQATQALVVQEFQATQGFQDTAAALLG